MIKKLINQTKRALLLAGVCGWGLSTTAQSGTYGNTFVFSGNEAAVHSVNQNFSTGGGAPLNGIVGTERVSPQGYVSFVGTATHTGASDAAHVDGYAKTYMSSAFTFPIGDNGKYRPARVSIASVANPANAAYFGVNPTSAITSSLKGGNEPVLPSSTYPSATKAADVQNVSTVEYWDINGTQSAQITLTWDAASGVAAMTGGALAKLTIVGWNGSQWVAIPSTVDATSILGGSSTTTAGSITTNSAITPSSYEVYTLAVSCPNTTPPTAAAASPNPICVGSSSLLTATAHATDTLKWYSDAGLTTLVGTGSPVNANVSVSPLVGTTNYFAVYTNGVCKTSSSSVSLIVNPVPNIASVDSVNPSTCTTNNGSITLKGLLPNTTYGYSYTNASGSGVTASGATDASGNLVIGSLVGGSYTNIQVSRLGCPSNTIAKVQLTPPAPTPNTPNTTPICLGKSSILSATGSGGTITWYADAALTASIGTGSPITVTPTATTTYYVAVVNGTCITAASTTTVTVTNDCPNFPIADTTVKNPTPGTPISAGPATNAPTGGTLTAAIIGGFYHKSVDAQSINPTTGVVTFTPNDTAFVGQDTIKRQVCYTLGTTTVCDTSLIVIDNKAPNTTDTDTTNLNTPKTLAALTPLIFEGGAPTTTTSSPKVTVSAGVPTYTPIPGFLGIDTQYVYRCDGASPPNCDTTRLIVSVLPSIADVKDSTTVNTPVNLGPAVTPSPNVTQNVTASNGTTSVNPDGTIKYTPNPNFVGTDTVKREVCVTTTAGTTCDTQLMIINVAPRYNDVTANTTQGTPVTSGQPVLTMPGSFSSIITTGPSNGTKVDNPGGTVTYTPNPSFVGRDTVTRRVCTNFPDGSQKCDTSLLVFIVTPKVADSKDSVPMNGGPVVTGSPVSGPGITVSASSKGGITTVNPDGTVTYKPNPGFTGIDTITRIICDTTPNPDVCDTSYIVMKVTPDLKDSTKSGKMNTPVTIGQPVTLGPGASQDLKGPANGTVAVNPDGTLKYTPNPNFVGMDTIKRIVCVNGTCDTAILVIKVTPDAKDTTAKTKEGIPVTVPGPGLVPGGGSTVAYTPAGGSSNGTATVNPTTGAVTYTPKPGFTGKDTVKVSVCVTYVGSATVCDTHLVIVDVAPVNKTNPDIAVGDKGVQIAGNVGTNDNVVAGTTYGTPIASTSNPSPVVPVMNANGTYTFTATIPGTYVFTVPVCPPGQSTGCPTETLTITVNDPTKTDNKPIVNTDYPITKPNTPVKVNVLANDASANAGFPLVKSSLTVSTAPKNGTATVNADGTIGYTPKPGFVGKDTFYYTICDSVTPPNCGTAMVIVNVTNEDLADVQDDVAKGKGSLIGNTLANDKFPVGSKPYVKPQDVIIPGKGRFVIDSAGNYIWTPEPGFTGNVQIVITTCDGKSPETCYNSTLHISSDNKATNAVIPNYFSPNGDGVNDVWNIDAVLDNYPNARALIYNRWGNIVWRSTGPYGRSTSGRNLWHGQQEGSQDLVPDGVYYYLLELEDEFKTTKTGFIEIMRQ